MSFLPTTAPGVVPWGGVDLLQQQQQQMMAQGQLYTGPLASQVSEAAAKLDSENITLDIRKVNNGYLISSRHGSFIAANADEVKDAVMQIMVKAKLNDAT